MFPENLQEAERVRPNRKPLESIAFHNVFAEPVSVARPSEERKNFDRDIVLVNDDGKDTYHIEQATLDAIISVDELNLEDQVAYGFIKELKNLGISVAAIPNITGMTASIFCTCSIWEVSSRHYRTPRRPRKTQSSTERRDIEAGTSPR